MGQRSGPKFTSAGTFVTTWGTLGYGNGQFRSPSGVAVDSSGYVYVTDEEGWGVQKFTSTGTFVTKWGQIGTGNGQFNYPGGVTVDSSGNVYVADTGNHRIQKFTSTGVFVTTWGSEGTGNGQFSEPGGVAVDSSGNVYVADTGNRRVQKFTSTGAFVAKWGSEGTGNGQFSNPGAVAVDGSGNVYVADSGFFDYDEENPGGHRVQKFTSTGTFVTTWGTVGGGNGQFYLPRGVAVDSSGKVYVAEVANHRVQRFRPADAVDPTVDLRVPAAGAVFEVGAAAFADFSCDDAGGSGLDTCVGTVADGAAIDTATGGERTFTVTATDHDGNETVVSHSYVVRDPVPGVSGTVTSSGSGAPVGGAWVAVLRASDFSIEAGAVADGSGNFSAAVAPGSYFLFLVDPSGAHTAGFGDAPSMVTVSATATHKTQAHPQMVSLRGSLAGTVTEAGSGEPIGGGRGRCR